MRWLPFLILAYLFVAVQFALAGVLQWGEVTPNLVLLLVIFIGLHAPVETAMGAAFTLGLMHDVVSAHGIGTYALAYTLIVVAAVQLRGIMYSDHFVTHLMITMILGTVLVVYLVFRQWVRNLYFPLDHTVSVGPQVKALLLTSALAIPTIWALRRIRRTFAFENK